MNDHADSGELRTKDFEVKIQTPESLVWEGRAESLTSTNSAGSFDILPQHGNMITLIERQPIEISAAGGGRKFTFEKAVIAVKDGRVTIYANISSGAFAEKK